MCSIRSALLQQQPCLISYHHFIFTTVLEDMTTIDSSQTTTLCLQHPTHTAMYEPACTAVEAFYKQTRASQTLFERVTRQPWHPGCRQNLYANKRTISMAIDHCDTSATPGSRVFDLCQGQHNPNMPLLVPIRSTHYSFLTEKLPICSITALFIQFLLTIVLNTSLPNICYRRRVTMTTIPCQFLNQVIYVHKVSGYFSFVKLQTLTCTFHLITWFRCAKQQQCGRPLAKAVAFTSLLFPTGQYGKVNEKGSSAVSFGNKWLRRAKSWLGRH